MSRSPAMQSRSTVSRLRRRQRAPSLWSAGSSSPPSASPIGFSTQSMGWIRAASRLYWKTLPGRVRQSLSRMRTLKIAGAFISLRPVHNRHPHMQRSNSLRDELEICRQWRGLSTRHRHRNTISLALDETDRRSSLSSCVGVDGAQGSNACFGRSYDAWASASVANVTSVWWTAPCMVWICAPSRLRRILATLHFGRPRVSSNITRGTNFAK